jgi:hypothetical protein
MADELEELDPDLMFGGLDLRNYFTIQQLIMSTC